jgi:uncharacterized protein (DUF2062 family)
MNLKVRFKEFYQQFISLAGEPRAIAFGMAIGVFVGVTPIIPFHTVLIVLLGIIFRKNITSAYLGSWLISNPITIPFFYLTEYQLGKFCLGTRCHPINLTDYSIWSIVNLGSDIAFPLIIGGLVLAPFFAVPAYGITYRFILMIRKKKHKWSRHENL